MPTSPRITRAAGFFNRLIDRLKGPRFLNLKPVEQVCVVCGDDLDDGTPEIEFRHCFNCWPAYYRNGPPTVTEPRPFGKATGGQR